MNSGISANIATNTHGRPAEELELDAPSSSAADEVDQGGLDVVRVVAQRRAGLRGRVQRTRRRSPRGTRGRSAARRCRGRRPRRAGPPASRRPSLPSAALSGSTATNIGLAAVADRLLERGRVDLARRLGRRVDVDVVRSRARAAASLTSCARATAGKASSSDREDEQDAHAQPPSTPRSRSRSSVSFFSSRALDDRDQHPRREPARPWRRASASAACPRRSARACRRSMTFTPLVSKRVSAPRGGS